MKQIQRKRNVVLILLSFILICSLCPVKVNADMGPKPTARVHVKGLEGKTYYMTLLSKTDSTGPWDTNNTFSYSILSGDDHTKDRAAWDAFKSYKDPDGFYFIGCYDNCTKIDSFMWDYYPPYEFKILIYLPDTDQLIVSSDIYELVGFNDIFDITIQDGKIINTQTLSVAYQIPHFLARLLLTLTIELPLAILFGYRKKLQLLIILAVNIATQLLLNLILYFVLITDGVSYTYKTIFIALEILIFVIEGLIYRFVLNRGKMETDTPAHPWFYSFCANLTSFLVGLLLTSKLPDIF